MAKTILGLGTYPLVRPVHGGQRRAAAFKDFYASVGVSYRYAAVYEPTIYGGSDVGPADVPLGAVADDTASLPYVADLLSGLFAAGAGYPHFRNLVERERPDAVQLEQPFMWPLVSRLRREGLLGPATPLIYSSHNWEGPLKEDILMGAGVQASRAREVRGRTEAWEREISGAAALTVAASPADAGVYRSLRTDPSVVLVTNGTDRPPSNLIDAAPLLAPFGRNPILLFVGSAYPPNVEGFCRLLARDGFFFTPPGKHVAICGGAASGIQENRDYRRFARANADRVQLFPAISDADLWALKRRAHCMLLPIEVGGGSNLKTAEAIASAKHVVGTSRAFRGFERFIEAAGVSVADTPADFRAAVIQTLQSQPLVLNAEERAAREGVYWDRCFADSGLAAKVSRLLP